MILNSTQNWFLQKAKQSNRFLLWIPMFFIGLCLSSLANAQVNNTESFDGTTFVPAGWTNISTSGTATWTRVTAGLYPVQAPHSGAGEARFNSYDASTGVRSIITPVIDLSNIGANTNTVSFWMYRDNGYNTTADKVEVLYNTTASPIGATLLGTVNRAIGLTPTVGANGWYQYSYTVPSTFNTATNYLIIRGTSAYGNDIYIDDVAWQSFPPVCSGTPNPGNTISSSAATCSGSAVSLSLQTATTGAGVTYQWQSADNNAFTTNLVNMGTAATQSASPTTAKWFRCNVTCASSGMSAYSNPVNVTINPFYNCYTVPTTVNGCNTGDHITNLSLTGVSNISNATGACISASYSNYQSSVAAAKVVRGQAVPISVSVANGGTEYASAWIDYNQNGTFEASENIVLTDADNLAPWIYAGTANIPITAVLGNTGLRIRSRYNSAIAAGDAAVNTFTYGETEDYLLNVLAYGVTASKNNVSCFGGSDGQITLTDIGGTAPFSYTISPNLGNQFTPGLFTQMPAGTYTIIATDAASNSASVVSTITQPTAPLTATITNTAPLCFGQSNGSLVALGSGGTKFGAPANYYYLYDWYNATTNTQLVNDSALLGVTAGNYYLAIEDLNGCVDTIKNITITQAAQLAIAPVVTQIACFGGTGNVAVNATGGTGTKTVSPSPTGLTAGTYNFTVTDANGCSIGTNIVINNAPNQVAISASAGTLLCNGNVTNATLITSGGTGAISTSPSNIGLAGGTYTFTATDANSCSATTSITIAAAPSAVTISISATQPLCFGDLGSVSITTGGGTGSIVLAPTTTTNLSAGTYTFTATDGNSCSTNATVVINAAPSAINVSLAATPIACFGGNSTVTVNATGGTGSYYYGSSGTSTTNTFTLTASPPTYTFVVRDANGCSVSYTNTMMIAQPSQVTISASASPILCFGGTTSATLNTAGGTGSIITSPASTGLMAGTYTFTATDANSCSATSSITISAAPSAVSIAIAATQPLCFGNLGSVAITTGGGTGSISVAPTTTSNLSAGTYTFTATDGNFCSKTASVVINAAPSTITVSLSATPIACFGGNSTVTVNATGGTGSYYYGSSGTNTNNSFSLPASPPTYTFVVRDANGCAVSYTNTIVINQPTQVSISATAASIVCFGGSTNVTLVTNGGTGAIATSPATTGLVAGTYTFTATDANSCSKTTSISITNPVQLTVPAVATPSTLCAGGSVSLSALATLAALPTGYCTATNSSCDEAINNVTFGAINNTTTCGNYVNYTALSANVSPGGTYTISVKTNLYYSGDSATVWIDFNRNGSLTDAGEKFNLTYTGSAGVFTGSIAVPTGASIGKTLMRVRMTYNITPTPCGSVSWGEVEDYTINVNAAGNTYAWTPSAGLTGAATVTPTITAATATQTYTVTLTSSAGCTATNSVTVNVNPLPNVTIANSNSSAVCSGVSSTLTASGATTYAWSPAANLSAVTGASVTANPVVSSTYIVTGTDANGCSKTASVLVNISPIFNVKASANDSLLCPSQSATLNVASDMITGPALATTYCTPGTTNSGAGDNITNVTFGPINNTTAAGGTNGYVSYLITPAALTPGATYTLNVTVANGGSEFAGAWIDFNSNGSFDASEFYNIPLTVSGGSYIGSVVVALPANVYATTRLRVRSRYNAALTAADACIAYTYGETEDYLLNIHAASSGNTYMWMPGSLSGASQTVTPSATTIYTLTATNATGCTATSTLQIVVNPTLTASASVSTPIPCVGSTGVISVSAAGGTAPYTGTGAQTAAIAGSYTYTVTDANGCTASTNATLVDPAALIAGVSANSTSLSTGSSLVLTTTPSGMTNYSVAGPGGIANSSASDMFTTNVVVANNGVYTVTVTNANGCTATSTISINVFAGSKIAIKTMLTGPYDVATLMMADSLRAKGLIPTTEPYSATPYNLSYTHVNGGGGEVCAASVFTVTGANAIVDWVFVQLRSAMDSTIVVATRSALIQRDGDVVDVDGVSPVLFANSAPGNYFVSVEHRNHLGIMTKNAQALTGSPLSLNLTTTTIPLFSFVGRAGNPAPSSGPTRLIGGVRCLYAGNCNIDLAAAANRYITYNNTTASDRYSMLIATGGTSTINGYTIFDIDMNGYARFNGLNPDRLIMLQNTANSNTLIVNEQTPN
jgi:GEVED domain/SprB repeat